MTDIPEDIAKAGERAALLWLGTAPDGIHRQPLSEAIARAILADRAAQAERIRELEEKLSEALRLLGRYRLETPAGHSPHMILAEVDEFAVRARSALGGNNG